MATYSSVVRVELALSASETCSAPSAPMLFDLRLRARAKNTRQGVLTVGKWRAAAYLRVCRVELVFSASEMCIAPSAPMLLQYRLPVGDENNRQGLLTV